MAQRQLCQVNRAVNIMQDTGEFKQFRWLKFLKIHKGAHINRICPMNLTQSRIDIIVQEQRFEDTADQWAKFVEKKTSF